MKKYLSILFTACYLISSGQTKTIGKSDLPTQINLSDSTTIDFDPSLQNIGQQPIPSAEYGSKKEELNKQRAIKKAELEQNEPQKKNASRGATAVNPAIVKSWLGNTANGSPNDNDIAVSNDGFVLSAVNSNIRIFNDTGTFLSTKSLSNLSAQVGFFSRTSDPRVLYDPATDRFVMTYFSGNLSTESVILVGFSQTNNPSGFWNFYRLNGASFNDSTWSDYPIIALSGNDLFITFNQVKDNVSWTVGFKQSVIWQIDKQKGYAGDSLEYTLWSDIKYNGGYLRNICPAKYQSDTMGKNMYFLSVRNVDFSNDSIFLLEITDSHRSGNALLTQRVLKSPLKYGFPPNAIQKAGLNGRPQQLMTNDARVLTAIYENDYIHFGLNSVNPAYVNAAVYLGEIMNVKNTNPSIKASLFSSIDKEYGYPSMSYLGTSLGDHKVMYTFSHCFTDSFPGTSVLYKDANGNFSDIIPTINGTSVIDVFSDTIERWGDYTNIQRRYNQPNLTYLAGSWGDANRMKTWISVVDINDPTTGTKTISSTQKIDLFPNPVFSNRFTTRFEMDKTQLVRFELLDRNGKLVSLLLNTKVSSGENEFSFSIEKLSSGIYYLKMSNSDGVLTTKKVIVQ